MSRKNQEISEITEESINKNKEAEEQEEKKVESKSEAEGLYGKMCVGKSIVESGPFGQKKHEEVSGKFVAFGCAAIDGTSVSTAIIMGENNVLHHVFVEGLRFV